MTIEQEAARIADVTKTNSVEAGYRMLQQVDQVHANNPAALAFLGQQLEQRGVLAPLSLAYLDDRQSRSGDTRTTMNDIDKLRNGTIDPLQRAMVDQIKAQFDQLKDRHWLAGDINSGIYQDDLRTKLHDFDQRIRERNSFGSSDDKDSDGKKVCKAGGSSSDWTVGKSGGSSDWKVGDAGRISDPYSRKNVGDTAKIAGGSASDDALNKWKRDMPDELTVRPGDSYWRLSSRALGHDNVRSIVDFNKLDASERARIRDLTEVLQKQHDNKMLHPGDIITIPQYGY